MRLPKLPTITLEMARETMAVGGLGAFTYGVWLAWAPAGFMVAGLGLMAPFLLRSYIGILTRGRG